MTALELFKLPPLMGRTTDRPEITNGLVDGPVAKGHPDFEDQNIRVLPAANGDGCFQVSSAKRGSVAPAICPDCSLVVRSIFSETDLGDGNLPSATPQQLAAAIILVIEAERARFKLERGPATAIGPG